MAALTVLSKDERARLMACEKTIREGLATFWEVGNALANIKTAKLYKEGYTTYEDYLTSQWPGLSRNYANRLVVASKVRNDLVPMGTVLPEGERQARPLGTLKTPKERQAVWKAARKAAEKAGTPVTAALVEEAVKDAQKPKPPPDEPTEPQGETLDLVNSHTTDDAEDTEPEAFPTLDCQGNEVDDAIAFIWTDHSHLEEALQCLNDAARHCRDYKASQGGFGSDLEAFAGGVSRIRGMLNCEKAKVGCVNCPGDDCNACQGRGWRYKTELDERPATTGQIQAMKGNGLRYEGQPAAECSRLLDLQFASGRNRKKS